MSTSFVCPDCGFDSKKPGSEFSQCQACMESAVAEPPNGWPVVQKVASPRKGRGVFARENLPPDTIVERCPAIILSEAESVASKDMAVLNRYLFPWGEGRRAITTGMAFLYNYASMEATGTTPNTVCLIRRGMIAVEFKTTRFVPEGEELTWDYRKARLKTR